MVAQSPASIWPSKGEGANLIDHFVVRQAWEWANDRDPNDPDDLGPARLARRHGFFHSWDKNVAPGVPAQSEQWQSDWWPCKRSAVVSARLDRHETYSSRFLSWRWRLATEQLLFSQQSRERSTGLPRYRSNYARMLLMCGMEDDFTGTKICSTTQRTAWDITMTPGKAIFLEKTGHSVDNERPDFFAGQVIEFLGLQ